MRPENILRGVAIELPVLGVIVGQLQRKDFLEVLNFRGQQIAVLVTDFRRTSFQVHVGPTLLRSTAKRALHPRIKLGRRRRRERRPYHGAADEENRSCSTHSSLLNPGDLAKNEFNRLAER